MLTLDLQAVRAMAGTPLTVLIVFGLQRQPCTLGFIRRHTGFSTQAVSEAVALLMDYGYLTQIARYTYQIALNVQQLPLMETPEEAYEAEIPMLEAIEVTAEEPPVEAVDKPVDNSVDNFVDSVSSAKLACKLQAKCSSSSRSINPENLDQSLLLARADSSQILQSNLAALKEHGVGEPARSRLAKLPHVTPELIRGHCSATENTGQAIYRIEHNWRCRAREPTGPKPYKHGDFAEFIN